MNKILVVFFCLLPLASPAETLEGIAKNQKKEILYIEKHKVEKDENGLNKYIRVEYLRPDGSLFATMTSDFSKNKFIPDTIYEDKRFQTKSVLRIENDSVIFEEIKNQKNHTKKIFPLNDNMVASQGFDNFIKINFSKLESNPVDFNFGVLNSYDFFSLTGYKKAKNESGDLEFGIKAKSWLLRIFAHELAVSYEGKTKQIKTFSGRSNILDDSGSPQDVTINYVLKNEI